MSDIRMSAYVALLLCCRAAEMFALWKTGAMAVTPKRDWTVSLILIPFALVVVGPPLEYMYFRVAAGKVSWMFGTLFFLAAMAVRTKAHLDLKKGFSMFIEQVEGQSLVDTGLYHHIRHPLYLGNLLLFIACPLFLGSRISWMFALLGLSGTLLRIKIEEQFLLTNMNGYGEYITRTSALIPGIF